MKNVLFSTLASLCLILSSGCLTIENKQSEIKQTELDAINRSRLAQLIANLSDKQARDKTGFPWVIRNKEHQVTGLALYGSDATDDNIHLISNIVTLERLKLACVSKDLTASSFTPLLKLKNLRYLVLVRPAPVFTKEMSRILSRLEGLVSLEITNCQIESESINYLMSQWNGTKGIPMGVRVSR